MGRVGRCEGHLFLPQSGTAHRFQLRTLSPKCGRQFLVKVLLNALLKYQNLLIAHREFAGVQTFEREPIGRLVLSDAA